MEIELKRTEPSDPDAIELAAASTAEGDRVYADLQLPPAEGLDALLGPEDRLLVAYVDGEPAGCGAVRRLDPHTGEIKRMFVVVPRRGCGIGQRLLRALEDEARDLGYERLCLDTGARQAEALGLYRSAGYREIPDYNGNRVASHWFEKRLGPSS